MRILFMGTPDFALESLKALCEANENVIGVSCHLNGIKPNYFINGIQYWFVDNRCCYGVIFKFIENKMNIAIGVCIVNVS